MEVCQSTKVATSDGDTAVTTGKSVVYGFAIHADGTNDVTVDIEDGTTDIITCTFDTSVQGTVYIYECPAPVKVTGGINVTVTGTNGYIWLFYKNS